jgi:type I restriction enzyme S subunit
MRLDITLPPGWAFPELCELALPEKGAIKIGPFGSSLKKHEYGDEGIRVLGIDHMFPNELVWEKPKFIPKVKYQALKQYTVKSGDILVTNMGTVGRTCYVPDDFPTAIISSHLIKVSLNQNMAIPPYISRALN